MTLPPDSPFMPVRVGDIVAGKYRIERTIGQGGMGVVMAAYHLALDERVALKFVLDCGEADSEAVERLVREARATFRLRSPNAVRVHDVGRLPSGPVYIVMELLEGRDLRAELAARGPLPPREVASHALDACGALEEAHAAGIVHRDLKPHNLFLTRSLSGKPIVKVLDFGLSKLDAELFEAEPLTRPETALGTPRYMAPEQWKSAAEVDARADVWALGIVMYELMTGRAPLQGMASDERRARLLAGAIPSPREARPDIPEGLARVVMRCLRADPAVRWASASHLAQAIRQAVPEVDAHPALASSRATGVTAVVPPEVRALQAALAFMGEPATVPVSAPSRAETPHVATPVAPRASPSPWSDPREAEDASEFEPPTEVRPPLFTAEELAALAPERIGDERIVAGTLRSEDLSPETAQAIREARQKLLVVAPVTAAARPSPPGNDPVASPAKIGVSVLAVVAVVGLLVTTAAFGWAFLHFFAR